MVLQRGASVEIWGTAAPGEPIQVEFRSATNATKADDSGNWTVLIDPGRAGGPFDLKVVGRTDTLALHDVLVGDVWFCSGQSNMAMRVRQAANAQKEIAEAHDTEIRQFFVERHSASTQSTHILGEWSVTSPETVGEYSATAYYFAREYRKHHPEVPIGLINSAWGGSVIQAWCSEELLNSRDLYSEAFQRWDNAASKYDALLPKYRKALAEWPKQVKQAEAAGLERPLQPRPPMGGELSIQHKPGGLYNAMVHPYIRFSIRGILWYQGESNRGQPEIYRELFPAMIEAWRNDWNRPDLPFLFVQLPNIGRVDVGGPRWPWIREAQTAALTLRNTFMAVTTDIGSTDNNIHPENKQDVGLRLSLLVRKHLDGEEVDADSPRYTSFSSVWGGCIVNFETFGTSLQTLDGKAPTGFEVAGPDREFHDAHAELRGTSVYVKSDTVEPPCAIRFAWTNLAETNLRSSAGLPVAPFRTDSWPYVPQADN